MAIQLVNECPFPQDIDSASLALRQEIGDRFNRNLELVQNAESAGQNIDSLISQAENVLNQILALGGAGGVFRSADQVLGSEAAASRSADPVLGGSGVFKNTDQVLDALGILKKDSTEEEEEKFVTRQGEIHLVKGVLHIPGTKSPNAIDRNNIQGLRRLYLATGRSLTRTEEILNTNRNSVILANKLELLKVSANRNSTGRLTPKSIDQIKKELNLDYLAADDISVNEDGTTLVLSAYNFLKENPKSKFTLSRSFGVTLSHIRSTVIHFNAIDNSTFAINKYVNIPYDNDELTAILQNQDLINFQTVIEKELESNQKDATNIISIIDFNAPRFSRLTNQSKINLRVKIKNLLQNLISKHTGTIAKSQLQVGVIEQKDILNKLRNIHTDEEISYLLENRQDIKGIYFESDADDIIKAIQRTSSANAGSSQLSNIFLNSRTSTTKKQLLIAASDLENALIVLNSNSNLDTDILSRIKDHLISFGGRSIREEDEEPEVPEFFKGQKSFISPTAILAERADTSKTLGLDAFLARLLGSLLEGLASAIEAGLRSCELEIEKARNAIFRRKKALDSFLAAHMSLIGSGKFENSLIKCAVNVNIGLEDGLLENLAALVDQLARAASEFITELLTWVVDLIENILCLHINLIDALVGKVDLQLPFACAFPNFTLGPEIETALGNLRSALDAKSLVYRNYTRELVTVRAEFEGASELVDQFQSGSTCNTGNVSRFLGATNLNLSGGVVI